MSTIKDVAEKANVSISTVSYVLSGVRPIGQEVKQKVLDAVNELNYISKRINHKPVVDTKYIGLFGCDIQNIGLNIFFHMAMSGILSVIYEKNYNLIVFPERRNDDEELYSILEKKQPVSGAIIIEPRINNDYLKHFVSKQIPYVLIGRPNGNAEKINYVDSDNVSIGYNSVKYLINHNHYRIVLINGPSDFTLSMDRLQGYKMALKDFNLPFFDELIINAKFSIEVAYTAVKNLLKNDIKFTAIIANNDLQAIGALKAIKEAGLSVPNDIALFCTSETYVTAYANPNLSGIDLNGVIVGENAANLMLSIIEKELIMPSHRIIPYTLNERESV
jgi:DNA-binding LacI/PurR family transcriptional regulator